MSKTLWSAEFSSRNSSFGSGVVIMDGNQITGGGEKYYYIGNCSINGNIASASVSIKQHVPGSSIFGPVSEFTLLLTVVLTVITSPSQDMLKKMITIKSMPQ